MAGLGAVLVSSTSEAPVARFSKATRSSSVSSTSTPNRNYQHSHKQPSFNTGDHIGHSAPHYGLMSSLAT